MDKKFKVRDSRKKGWFFLDNEYLNGMGKYVGPIGISVYVSLCRHSDNSQRCFPSQKTISEEIGVSERSVRQYLKKLEQLNVLVSEKERRSDGSWLNNVYYLVDKTEWKYPKAGGSDGQPEANDDTSRGTSRPIQRQEVPIKNTNKNNTNKNKTNIDTLFEKFWNNYPKKVGKPVAERSFKKLKPTESLLEEIIKGINKYKNTDQWIKNNGEFIPYPATFLNQRRWEDQIEADEEIEIPEYAKNFNKI